MSFAENLQYLRKKFKITQEELAEEMQVSRQSVSKWETGESYPETEKLISLCDKFRVSMDTLTRGDVAGEVVQDSEGFIRHINKFSLMISWGVFLILVGVSLCVFIAGFGTEGEEWVGAVAGAVVLLFVAAAVFLFVYAGITHGEYVRKYPEMTEVFSAEEAAAFHKKFTLTVALLVTGILLDVTALVVAFAIAESRVDANPQIGCYITSVFLFVLGGLVAGLCYMGIQHNKYDVAEYNRENRHEKAKNEGVTGKVCSSIMLLATATFLVCGFVWNLWHPAWVVFPVCGILCGIVGTLFGKGE